MSEKIFEYIKTHHDDEKDALASKKRSSMMLSMGVKHFSYMVCVDSGILVRTNIYVN